MQTHFRFLGSRYAPFAKLLKLARVCLGTTLATGLAALSVSGARAGGYDTPVLYSAGHMGLGGAAIAYVDDPSAMFHNPAGLMGTKGLTLMLDATLILGSITASPTEFNPNEESEGLTAIAPLIGVSLDYKDLVAFGVAFFPVASAGGEYLYKDAGSQVDTRNFTSVKFLELSPGVAFKIPGTGLSIGAGYRIDFVTLGRFLGPQNKADGDPTFDVEMKGTSFTGFRVGLQWQPIKELQLGLVFRSHTRATIEDPAGVVLLPGDRKVETDFVLPAKLGFGVRANIDPVALVLDLEYGLYSQNRKSTFKTDPATPIDVVNVFDWSDALTLRAGVEYGYLGHWFFRGGFIYDGQVSNEQYPSAFGTPPTSTITLTAGVGYKHGDDWKLNFAFAQRFGSTKVERGTPTQTCLPCSANGDYSLTMSGLYLDFTYAFPHIFD